MKYLVILLLCCCHNTKEDEQLAVERAKNAIIVNEYRERLQECKAKGKDAGSISVYERCAQEVDTKYGVTPLDGGSSNGIP